MGLMLSLVLTYAGINDAIECLKHIIRGVVPADEPNFQDLVEYYTSLLQKSANSSSPGDWLKESGQGYLCLTEDKNGTLKSATVKYYGETRSTAILFSTKITSFGQDSVEDNTQVNGDYKGAPAKTKTIISQSSESFSVGQRNNTYSGRVSLNSTKHVSKPYEYEEKETAARGNLTKDVPEIHFQSYDDDKVDRSAYNEDFLRSLDGIKFRPLQRNDPSGRRRSFRKRHSSSSNSSRDSRASRDDELKMFTSLEEEEFRKMNKDENFGTFGSTPNLTTRSHSRSRSRENSKERRSEKWSTEGSLDSTTEEDNAEMRSRLKDLPKLDSFAEEKEEHKETNEVTEEEEEDVDFWANFGD